MSAATRTACWGVLICVSCTANAGSLPLSAARPIIRAEGAIKAARLATLTARDLRYASRPENVDSLLSRAVLEGRIDQLSAMRALGPYASLNSGDLLLLQCLKTPGCAPLDCITVARRSDLHAQVLLRRPDLNPALVNHAVGDISEQVMITHFEVSGWIRLEGQVGRGGIDGLFIKRTKDGAVRDVLIVESKYNTSALKPTNHGTQMSRDWVLKKLEDLSSRHPDNRDYPVVSRHVEQGIYRSRLWSMNVQDGSMKIELTRIHSKNDVVELVDSGADRVPQPTASISIASPEGERDRAIVRRYRLELDRIGVDPGNVKDPS
jgi:hypothetical protein